MKKLYACTIIFMLTIIVGQSAFAQCNNVTSGGTIGSDQANCGIYNPSTMTTTTLPSGGTGTLQYQWQSSPNNSTWTNIFGATLQNYLPNVISSTTYYRLLSRRSGCTTYDGISNVVTKTVNPEPSVSVSAGGPLSFCAPGSVLLTANATGVNYQWRKNGNNINGATSQNYLATTTGQYAVLVTAIATGCTALSFGVNVSADAPLNTTITETGSSYCAASTVLLQAYPGYTYSYQWFEDGNLLAGMTQYQYGTGHNGNYSCTITNSCGSYPSATYSLQNSNLASSPYGFIYANGSTALCNGQSVTLYEINPYNFFGYQWYKDGVAIPGALNPNYTASAPGNYGLRVTEYCPYNFMYNDFFTNWITITSTGQSLPSPVISAGGNTTFCQGGNVVLTSTTSGIWYRDGFNVSGLPSLAFTASVAGTYQCAATNSCGTAYSNTINITVLPITSSISLNGLPTICNGAFAKLTSTGAGTGGTYQWKLNGSNISGATQSTYYAGAGGNYTCAIANTCTTYVSNSIAINVSATCGTGLQFDGVNDFASFPANAAYNLGTGNFTFESWIKIQPNQNTSQSILFSNRTPGFYGLTIFLSGNVLAIALPSNTQYINIDLRDSICHHLTITRTNGFIYAYIDGTTTLGGSSMTGDITTGGPLSIGSMPAGGSYLAGKMMEVRFWNYSRTLTQIQNNMYSYLTGTETGLIGYWRLNDGSGQVLNDFSVYNNDGQLGSTATTDVNDPLFGSICPVTSCIAPGATITAAGPVVFCNGGSVVLNANTGVGLTYAWRLNGAAISGATSASYAASASGNYSCLVSNACSTSVSNTITVDVQANPSGSINASGSTSICPGGSVVLNVTAGSNSTFQWKAGGNPIAGATSTAYTATAGGSYTCTVTNGCGSITTNAITVTVVGAPTATITAGGPTTFCEPSSVTLSANTAGISTYQWNKNGSSIALATNSSYVVTTTGNYTCTVTNGCGISSTSSVISVTVNPLPVFPGPITGTTTICQNTFSVPYSISPVTGATSYTWTVPAGSSISSGQGTENVFVDFGASGGNICVTGNNSCGSGNQRCLAVTTSLIPSLPNPISGSAQACANTTNNVYSISGVTGATSFTWTLPTGASFVSGQGTSVITVSFGANGANGNICVYAGNACGTNFTCKAVTAVSAVGVPASISGTTTPCANSTGIFYSCASVANASSYLWTVPASATITGGQGTTGITVDFNGTFSSGTIGVSAVNCAGTSASRTLAVYGLPGVPASITGQSTGVCPGTANVQYTVPAVPGAASYTWTAPSNATITNGQGTATVRLSFGNGFSSGTLSVRAVNACGTGAARTLSITSNPPMPGTITGPATFCANSNVVYSVAAVAGATTYNWDVPSGASITSGQGTTSVTVHHGTHSGKIKVRAGNACGFSSYQILNVTKTCREGGVEEEFQTMFNVNVFPNPSSMQFTLVVNAEADVKYDFILRDITGREIETRKNLDAGKPFVFGNQLANGIYFAEIITGEERKIVRVIKQE